MLKMHREVVPIFWMRGKGQGAPAATEPSVTMRMRTTLVTEERKERTWVLSTSLKC